MTREELNELKAQHANGARIQARVLWFIGCSPAWTDVADPMWNGCTEYRIKPEPTQGK